VAGVSGTSAAIPQPLPDDDDEADEQPGNGGSDHDKTDKADCTKHDVAHRDLTSDGRLPDGLDDDGAGLRAW